MPLVNDTFFGGRNRSRQLKVDPTGLTLPSFMLGVVYGIDAAGDIVAGDPATTPLLLGIYIGVTSAGWPLFEQERHVDVGGYTAAGTVWYLDVGGALTTTVTAVLFGVAIDADSIFITAALAGSGGGITQFRNLLDVDVLPLAGKDRALIRYDLGTDMFVDTLVPAPNGLDYSNAQATNPAPGVPAVMFGGGTTDPRGVPASTGINGPAFGQSPMGVTGGFGRVSLVDRNWTPLVLADNVSVPTATGLEFQTAVTPSDGNTVFWEAFFVKYVIVGPISGGDNKEVGTIKVYPSFDVISTPGQIQTDPLRVGNPGITFSLSRVPLTTRFSLDYVSTSLGATRNFWYEVQPLAGFDPAPP